MTGELPYASDALLPGLDLRHHLHPVGRSSAGHPGRGSVQTHQEPLLQNRGETRRRSLLHLRQNTDRARRDGPLRSANHS